MGSGESVVLLANPILMRMATHPCVGGIGLGDSDTISDGREMLADESALYVTPDVVRLLPEEGGDVGRGVAVALGVALARGVGDGLGVALGRGVAVGLGVPVARGVAVGRGVTAGVGVAVFAQVRKKFRTRMA